MGTLVNVSRHDRAFRVPGVGDTDTDRMVRHLDRARTMVLLLRYLYNRHGGNGLQADLMAAERDLAVCERELARQRQQGAHTCLPT